MLIGKTVEVFDLAVPAIRLRIWRLERAAVLIGRCLKTILLRSHFGLLLLIHGFDLLEIVKLLSHPVDLLLLPGLVRLPVLRPWRQLISLLLLDVLPGLRASLLDNFLLLQMVFVFFHVFDSRLIHVLNVLEVEGLLSLFVGLTVVVYFKVDGRFDRWSTLLTL